MSAPTLTYQAIHERMISYLCCPFSDHYNVFTILVAVKKLQLAGLLSTEEWKMFYETHPNPDASTDVEDSDIPDWIETSVWNQVCSLDRLQGFQGLKKAIKRNDALWKEYFDVIYLVYFFSLYRSKIESILFYCFN